jgi:hypothetical protein
MGKSEDFFIKNETSTYHTGVYALKNKEFARFRRGFAGTSGRKATAR